jgi:hypothetical protein
MDKTMQIVLEPGGKLEARASMKTVVTKHRRHDCTSYVAGPLAAGEYELRVHGPLFPVDTTMGQTTAGRRRVERARASSQDPRGMDNQRRFADAPGP